MDCSINFDGRGDYSRQGKGERVVLLLGLLRVSVCGWLVVFRSLGCLLVVLDGLSLFFFFGVPSVYSWCTRKAFYDIHNYFSKRKKLTVYSFK